MPSYAYANDAERLVFEYLDTLRKSGRTNMFGAAPYLQKAFGLPLGDARVYLAKWMETFGERHAGGDDD